jgi:site-specific recombinase XerD
VKHIEDCLEKDTVDTLLGYVLACNSRDYLMLRILWRTGIRVSELLSIRPRNLESHNQVVNIVKAKGSKQRRVMLDQETLDMLSEYISTHNIQVSTHFYPLERAGLEQCQEIWSYDRRRRPPPYVQAQLCHSPHEARP